MSANTDYRNFHKEPEGYIIVPENTPDSYHNNSYKENIVLREPGYVKFARLCSEYLTKKNIAILYFFLWISIFFTAGMMSNNIMDTIMLISIIDLASCYLTRKMVNAKPMKILLHFIPILIITLAFIAPFSLLNLVIAIFTAIGASYANGSLSFINPSLRGVNYSVGSTPTFSYASDEDCRKKVWGIPGSHIGSQSHLGTAAEIGARGERLVGEELKKLTIKYPHVRVFNGVHFKPGDDRYDVDHVVLIGYNIFLIDAKYWKIGHYSWTHEGTILRDGEEFVGGNVHMDGAMEHWQKRVKGLAMVSSIITLAMDEHSKKYSVDNSSAPSSLSVLPLRDVINLLGVEAEMQKESENGAIVDRRLVGLLMKESF